MSVWPAIICRTKWLMGVSSLLFEEGVEVLYEVGDLARGNAQQVMGRVGI